MPVADTLFMRAARREPVERTPVWFMRQAGRVLPEYRAVRERMTLLEICRHPELCTEVTLQPLARFPMDAAILFADLMHPLVAVGIDLEIQEHIGPVIASPIRTRSDVARLRPIEPEADLPELFAAIRLIKRELADRVPLLGFGGAPFTLASYLVEGRPTRDFLRTKAMMYGDPDTWHALMERLADIVAVFLKAKIDAGANAVQLFDSWVGCLSPQDYETYVRPHTARLLRRVAESGVPVIHFGTNTTSLLEQMRDDGGSIVGVDWRVPLDAAWRVVGHDKGIQGNLDPALLLAPHDVIERGVRDVLARAEGRPGHIFNLGHGLHPSTPVDGIAHAVACVRELSANPQNLAVGK
jgi:uroporphyrinogen decarboxylase